MKETNQKELEKIISNSSKLLVVEFFATWCRYCKILNSELEKITEFENFEILKVDVDKEPLLALYYQVEVYPTVVFIKEGKIVNKIFGSLEKKEVLEEINKYL